MADNVKYIDSQTTITSYRAHFDFETGDMWTHPPAERCERCDEEDRATPSGTVNLYVRRHLTPD